MKLERNKLICIDVLNGWTLKEVGLKYGLTAPRIRQILSGFRGIINQVSESLFSESREGRSSCSLIFLRRKKDTLIPLIEML